MTLNACRSSSDNYHVAMNFQVPLSSGKSALCEISRDIFNTHRNMQVCVSASESYSTLWSLTLENFLRHFLLSLVLRKIE